MLSHLVKRLFYLKSEICSKGTTNPKEVLFPNSLSHPRAPSPRPAGWSRCPVSGLLTNAATQRLLRRGLSSSAKSSSAAGLPQQSPFPPQMLSTPDSSQERCAL